MPRKTLTTSKPKTTSNYAVMSSYDYENYVCEESVSLETAINFAKKSAEESSDNEADFIVLLVIGRTKKTGVEFIPE